MGTPAVGGDSSRQDPFAYLNTVAFLFFLQGLKVDSLLLEKYLYFFLELLQLSVLLLV